MKEETIAIITRVPIEIKEYLDKNTRPFKNKKGLPSRNSWMLDAITSKIKREK